jgi:hypothetical protein
MIFCRVPETRHLGVYRARAPLIEKIDSVSLLPRRYPLICRIVETPSCFRKISNISILKKDILLHDVVKLPNIETSNSVIKLVMFK